MITVTPAAAARLRDILSGHDDVPGVRVYAGSSGCGGPVWQLRVDEPSEQDEVLEGNGYRVIIERSLTDEYGGVTVDFMASRLGEGFQITHEKTLGRTCGTCHC